MAAVMPSGRPLTIEDLYRFPSDGNRYELIRGSLHVNPSTNLAHQRVSSNLHGVLQAGCPDGSEVLAAPFDVVLGPDTLVQPDLLVAHSADADREGLRGVPLLVVEILSPSSRQYDLGTKRRFYQDAGIGSYWVVDPDVPSVTVLEWSDGEEITDRTVRGGDELRVDRPFPVVVRPADLIVPGGGRRHR